MATAEISPHILQAIEVYSKGTKAWFEDENEAWVSAEVISKEVTDTDVKIIFQNDEQSEREHVFESKLRLLEKNNGATLPPLRNPPRLENIDDLTNLSHLNEPSVLNTIRIRYAQRNIYTYSGIVLIAANPFDRVPLYEPDIIQQYSGRRRGELEPHLFAIAEDAYRCMIREKTNQTIVVSGESGAGKTVSAKYIMRYFATADDKESVGKITKEGGGGMTEVEEQILATNPIMEAFGNAKTTRNDNSSRFGKYIEIQFDKSCNIVGAKIRTYLLERSRLIFQPETERNYHIFYQLCSGAPINERKELDLKDWTKFHYLNQSGTGVIPGVDDVEEFELTQRSLSMVGIAVQTQWQIFRLLAALLHIGNIEIGGRNDATLASDEPSLVTATSLLGIKPLDFKKWLTRRQIITRSESIVTNLNPTQANIVKDSVAKYIYASLFDWLVDVVNRSLSCQEEGVVSTFIGVLDIYGFEHFKKNSFEQFCINYANEKLQQQFNQHVFKLEQEEYVKEKIDWKFIEFSDNQRCIEMIEAKLGILSLLDEESRLPSGSDQGFCDKLYNNFTTPTYKNYFKKPRFSNKAFTVVHYAHEVEYDAEGFMDKNKDTVPDEILTMLQHSDSQFLVDMLHTATEAANASAQSNQNPAPAAASTKPGPMKRGPVGGANKKPTLGSIFKLSLISLMDTIGQTNVHYIRCIKPNEAKVAWVFDANMVLAQLRACGVLETIRISCAGYPSRWTFDDFADRYYALVNSKYWDPHLNPDLHQLCSTILDKAIQDKDKYQVGLTKIFFRAGQLAYLEKLRADRWNECTVLLQKNMRRFITRIRYVRMKELALRLQQVARKKVAQRNMELIRQNNAAVVIQAHVRGYLARQKQKRTLAFVISLQAASKRLLARRYFAHFRENHAATQIQRLVRGWAVRKRIHGERKFITSIQANIRRRQAKKHLQQLRAEAKSASHLQQVSYKLESKVVELTQHLTLHKDEKEQLKVKTTQLEAQVQSWIDKYNKMESKSKSLEISLAEATETKMEYQKLQQAYGELEETYQVSQADLKQRDDTIQQLKDEIEKQKNEMAQLKLRPARIQTDSNSASHNNDVAELKNQIAALKTQLSQSLKAPKRQGSINSPYPRNLSPSSRGGAGRGLSPERGGRSPSTPGVGGAAHRMQSPLSLAGQSSGINNQHSDFTTSPSKLVYAEPEQMRPMSLDHKHLQAVEAEGNPEEAVRTILQDEGLLDEEILNGLIVNLKILPPNSQQLPAHQEVVFPAHNIGLCITQMWRYGYLAESERVLFTVMDTIQKYCLGFSGEDTIVPCAYWLSNAHELLSLVCSTEQELEREMNFNSMNGRRAVGWHDFEKLVATVKYELQCLEDNIYHHWLTELKKRLNKMAVPALIEYQSLPGFIATDNSRFFGKILAGSNQPAFTMDELLNFLNRIYRAMKCYYVSFSVIEQVLTELLKLIGVSTFNDLVMRRNYNSWKRAMQIQYNITRLEEWCKSHEVADATLQLEHLMQAAKLLQLKKVTQQDITTIYDVCWLLAPTQVQKLLQNYYVADYEDPISNDILGAVASRVSSGDTNDILLLDNVSLDDSPYEVPEPETVVTNNYLPAFLQLQRLQRLMSLMTVIQRPAYRKDSMEV
ncbi:P-loop containing nucleoside triphosphate hydrolase protein [Halteromyces radiatus]|uniref:P-loop containing nucleoside triphosphate hydrolase protein n=1 Tax=Halteromyces radiatus TaxID=101107 RepID=UPI00221F191D|nr:P-loop containing nucleoside triphosphate hydrolase protein [Halteromyces radiatus]KAI8097679.1 P-loop containing nucleoside triphosphate hydrolase protein [Halteromyces radiatus]